MFVKFFAVMLDRILLFPYTIALALRDRLFDKGIFKSSKADVPTVSIGNITAGGTGKTPHTEMVVRTLLQSDDWAFSNIAILSRGYKRRSRGFQKVSRDGSASDFGDEPVQMAGKFPSVTVAVDKDRVEGCRFLAHPDQMEGNRKARRCKDKVFPPSDIIILDDAFQHRRLKPSLNIVLVDWNRPLHKDKLIPFGRLRDLPRRISEADIVIVTKCPLYMDEWEKGKWAGYLDIKNYSTATCKGVFAGGKSVTLLFSTVGYKSMEPVFPEADSRYMYSHRAILFTGIAKDTPMRMYISDSYKIVRHFRFSDHRRYRLSDVRKATRATRYSPTAVVITTEKDAQRLRDIKKMPAALKERLFQLPIEVEFLTPGEKEVFETTLLSFLKGYRPEA